MHRAEKFKCEIISWARVIRDAKKLSDIIRKSDYDIDIVVAVGRGGYVPARILCDHLLIRDLTSIKVEHWGTAVTSGRATVKIPLSGDIKNKNVLVVDDVTDTGETLRVSLDYLKEFEPKKIKSAVLMHKICSKTVPDYFVKKVVKWRWIIFPWHVHEDITEFVKSLISEGIISEETVIHQLYNLYGIRVKPQIIKEILSEIKNGGEGIRTPDTTDMSRLL